MLLDTANIRISTTKLEQQHDTFAEQVRVLDAEQRQLEERRTLLTYIYRDDRRFGCRGGCLVPTGLGTNTSEVR